MSRRKISTTIYLEPEQTAQLKLLHAESKVPVAEMIRQGIDLYLQTKAEDLKRLEDAFLDAHPEVVLGEPQPPTAEEIAAQMRQERREAIIDAICAAHHGPQTGEGSEDGK